MNSDTEGAVNIEIDGITADTEYDQLALDGDANLANVSLNVSFIEGFIPSAGNTYTILTTTGTVSNTFETVNLPVLDSGLVWDLRYNTNNVVLEVINPFSPTVESPNPATDANQVPITTNVVVSFDEPMDTSSFTGNFTLVRQSDSTPVTGVMRYDDLTNTMIFDPDENLLQNTTYTATVSGSVTDESEDPMGTDYIWSFTTAEGVIESRVYVTNFNLR